MEIGLILIAIIGLAIAFIGDWDFWTGKE